MSAWQVREPDGKQIPVAGGLHNEVEAVLFATAILRKRAHPPTGTLIIVAPDGCQREFSIKG